MAESPWNAALFAFDFGGIVHSKDEVPIHRRRWIPRYC